MTNKNKNVSRARRINLIGKSFKFTAKKYSAMKDVLAQGFSVDAAIRQATKEIEKEIGARVVGFKRVKKAYGSNANSFFVKTYGNHIHGSYFLKFGRDKNIDNELKGDDCIRGILKTPKVILSSRKKLWGYEWVLYEYVHGQLMNELLLENKDHVQMESLFDQERRKEKALNKLYIQKIPLINFSDYLKSRANKLFHARITGKRFSDFYENGNKNIASLFDRTIIINDMKLPLTINQIIHSIKIKYRNSKTSARVQSIIGHGDAHHGNILVNKDIWFIDNEYADVTTPYMELAKPYYNDFLGNLFFHKDKLLKKHFKIHTYKDTGKEIRVRMSMVCSISNYIEIIKIKLSSRKSLVNGDTKDFISFNDYLFLCHILTKNPNNYSEDTKKFFLIFAVLLEIFDPLKPESIYPFLELPKNESSK